MEKGKFQIFKLLTIIALSIFVACVLVSCDSGYENNEPHNKTVPKIQYNATNSYMQMAIDEARTGIYNNCGGPFGSVIVKDGEIIGRGHNKVLVGDDSTAHGEMMAIRCAENKLHSHDLAGCELYTTGQPCPMCLSACMWANIKTIYYGCTIQDNDRIGFRDQVFDEALGGVTDGLDDYISIQECDRDACLKLFDEYNSLNRETY